MAHMNCVCGNDMWDGDGEIVYDIYTFKEIKEYMKKYPTIKDFKESFQNEKDCFDPKIYFWKCNKCNAIHVWFYESKECFRRYEITSNKNIDINKVKQMEEILVANIYDFELFENIEFNELMKNNPIKKEKYFISNDLSKIYIYNTITNKIDIIYDLKYESFSDIQIDIKETDDKTIYIINKINDGLDYNVENGRRIPIENDDYPHIEVHNLKKINIYILEKRADFPLPQVKVKI